MPRTGESWKGNRMAREYEEKTETKTETRTTNELVRLICDICGKEGSVWREWAPSLMYHDADTTIEYTFGTSYPDGGSSTKLVLDICPDCFTGKLVPWVESFGIGKVREEYVDW